MIRPLMRYILVLLGLHHMVQTIERPTGKTKSQTVLTWREASAKQWRTSERKTEGHFSSGVPQHAWQRIQHHTNYKSSKDQTTSSSDSLVVELKHFFCMLQGEHSDQLPAAWHLLFTTLTALMVSGGCFVLEGCFVLSTPGSCRSRQESRGPLDSLQPVCTPTRATTWNVTCHETMRSTNCHSVLLAPVWLYSTPPKQRRWSSASGNRKRNLLPYIGRDGVERVTNFRFLGTHISQALTWTVNTT